jgi:RNA recognition motif-containing protein
MPVDRETGRPRGFAFVEFADRAVADQVIKRFDAQPFQGRNLAVSEARAREDRPPGSRPPGGGFGGPRPPGGGFAPRPPGGGGFAPRPSGGFGGPRPGGPGGPSPGGGGRDRSANFGPPAPPKRLRGKKGQQQEHRPRGPIKEKTGGRIYDVDDLEEGEAVEFENLATSAPGDVTADVTGDVPDDKQDDDHDK